MNIQHRITVHRKVSFYGLFLSETDRINGAYSRFQNQGGGEIYEGITMVGATICRNESTILRKQRATKRASKRFKTVVQKLGFF